MNKISCFLLTAVVAVGTLALSSCSSEDNTIANDNGNDNRMYVKVTAGGPGIDDTNSSGTRSALDDSQSGSTIPWTWSAGDKLYVLDATGHSLGTLALTSTVGQRKGEFGGYLTGVVPGTTYRFVYMGAVADYASDNLLTLNISQQAGTKAGLGDYDVCWNTGIIRSDGTAPTMELKKVLATAHFKVTIPEGENVGDPKHIFIRGKNLYSGCTISFNTSNITADPTLTPTTEAGVLRGAVENIEIANPVVNSDGTSTRSPSADVYVTLIPHTAVEMMFDYYGTNDLYHPEDVGSPVVQDGGADWISAPFSISATQTVNFSSGNLQFVLPSMKFYSDQHKNTTDPLNPLDLYGQTNPINITAGKHYRALAAGNKDNPKVINCNKVVAHTGYYQIAKEQWYVCNTDGEEWQNLSGTEETADGDTWITGTTESTKAYSSTHLQTVMDLFGWGTKSNPGFGSLADNRYLATTNTTGATLPLANDWGQEYGTSCRCLTMGEWEYLLGKGTTVAANRKFSNGKLKWAQVTLTLDSPMPGTGTGYTTPAINSVPGLLIFNDNTVLADVPSTITQIGLDANHFTDNTLTVAQLNNLNAVFLPEACTRFDYNMEGSSFLNSFGYWTTTLGNEEAGGVKNAYTLQSDGSNISFQNDYPRHDGMAVRIVKILP